MAEYFPLLDRAVSGLTEPTAEARRSIYERARAALIGQLRRMDPPVPEEDIARESAALDEAIARVEAGFAGRDAPAAPRPQPDAPAPSPAAPAPALPPAAPSPAAPPAVPLPVTPAVSPSVAAPSVAASAAVPGRVTPPPLPTGAPPIVPPPSRERPVLGPRPALGGVRLADAAARPAVRAPLPPRGTRPVMALRPVVPAPERDAVKPVATAAPAADVAPDAVPPAAPAAPAEAEAGFAAALDAAARGGPDGSAPADAAPASTVSDAPAGARRETTGPSLRPPAPRPRETDGRRRPAIIAGVAAAVLVMAGMGVAAYRWRDRPEQVVASRSPVADAPGAAAGSASPGKAVDRAASADADAAAQPTSGATVPAPVPLGGDAGVVVPSIAVAQRAALLVDAPDDPQRVRTYVGTVVWHLDSVSPGGGQPLATAVKADVDIPDAKLKVTMLMQKNPEPQLPASHTIEFHFLPQPGNTLGPVKQVNVPEMRRDDDAPTGDSLAGVPVAITDNYFLVGLTRGAAETQNTRLMAERNWFDISMLFTSGKLGKLTFEKGAGGQRVIDDALKAWK